MMRSEDQSTARVVEDCKTRLQVSVVMVEFPGQVCALNAALQVVRSDVVAFLDDDAVPRQDWLERIGQHYREDPFLGGVGGRDVIPGELATPCEVGRVRWFGRIVGNHHIGMGPPRPVDTLKGVNMSFRSAAIGAVRFDHRLLGDGAQVHNDLAFCLAIRRKGWQLVYDPLVAVDHFPAQRGENDQRSAWSPTAAKEEAYNMMLAVTRGLSGFRRFCAQAWQLVAGTKLAPGTARAALSFAGGDVQAVRRSTAALAGRIAALRVVT